MLRIIKEYPQGWGSTNSPPSDILVSRDTSWFVHGFDYFLPGFSRDAIEVFNRFLQPNGQVVEYVRGVERILDLVRSQHQRRYAAAPDRDPASLQRDARPRMGQRVVAADRADRGLHPLAARQERPGVLQRQGRRHVRHHLVAQHHPAVHARRRRHGNQRRGGLRARSGGDAVRGRRRRRALVAVLERGDDDAREDDGPSLQRRHGRVRAQLRQGRKLSRQLHVGRSLSGALQHRGAEPSGARYSNGSPNRIS